jgi:hypothetical protein
VASGEVTVKWTDADPVAGPMRKRWMDIFERYSLWV